MRLSGGESQDGILTSRRADQFYPNGADAPVYQPARSSENGPRPLVAKSLVPWLWTWNGYYLGINAGYSWGRSNRQQH